MTDANKKGGGTGAAGNVGYQKVGTTDPSILEEHDLPNEIHGRNRLQGNDQSGKPNQRLTLPGSLDPGNEPFDPPVEEARRHDEASSQSVMARTILRTAGAVALVCSTLGGGIAWGQATGPACTGDSTTVQRGDTLSRIAERCDVSEGAILAANPTLDGSGDLRVGGTVVIRRETDGSLRSRLNDLASDANDAVGRVAGRVNSSVQDLLDKNPDLASRLEGVGRKIGLDGSTAAPAVAVTPSSGPAGSVITVTATGLPPGTSASIDLGAAGTATETVQSVLTSSTGTLTANVTVPSWASASTVVFTVRVGDEVKARSGRFQVTP